MLWHYVAQVSPSGGIGVVTDLEIAGAVAWEKKPSVLISALVDCGWLNKSEEHRLVVHDWPHHCDNYIWKVLRRKKRDFLSLYGVSVYKSEDLSGQMEDILQTKSVPTRVAEAEARVLGSSLDSSEVENTSTRAREKEPAEWPEPRPYWERNVGKLKAAERRLWEERMPEVRMPLDEWHERIDAYKQSEWAQKNGFPLRGFLKNPQSWESLPEVATSRPSASNARETANVDPSPYANSAELIDSYQNPHLRVIYDAYVNDTPYGPDMTVPYMRGFCETFAALTPDQQEKAAKVAASTFQSKGKWAKMPLNWLAGQPWTAEVKSNVRTPLSKEDEAKAMYERWEKRKTLGRIVKNAGE